MMNSMHWSSWNARKQRNKGIFMTQTGETGRSPKLAARYELAEQLKKDGERIDELQRNEYLIFQHPGRFCFGMDAVLLSGFVRIKPGSRVLDLGTGTGILPILMEAKTKGQQFTGLEIQEESADMAARSVAVNGLSEKVRV